MVARASGSTLLGTGSAQVEHGRVDVEFGPFTVTLSGGNGGVDVSSPAVSRYSFEDLDGNPVFPAAGGVLLTAASENAPFGTDANPIFPNTSFLSATEVDNGGFLDVRTFEVTGLLDPDDPSAGVQDNGDDIPDRNLELDHDFNFAYFPFADGWVAGHAFPDDTDANGPLTSIIADGIQLVQEADFDTYDGSFAAVVDVPDLPADIALT